MNSAQVKSRERVTDHGEVYTNSREVNAMLDLVKQETERIEARFLEPACGHGNFLAAILERKLEVVEARYKKSQIEFERYAVLAVGSIYGIDLLEDNVREARLRLFYMFEEKYKLLFRNSRDECLESVLYLLGRNIIVGDALDLTTGEGEPIIFSEWSLVTGDLIKRRDYSFEHLVANIPLDGLFSDLGDDTYIQTPVAEFPPVDFATLSHAYEGTI